MKILVCKKVGGAFGFITEGWINALRSAGHNAQRWDGHHSSWQTFDPDLYLGCSGHWQQIPASRGRAKVATHVNPYGKFNTTVNEDEYSFTRTVTERPDLVFGYAVDAYRKYWCGWEEAGVRWHPLPTAGDSTIYYPRGLPRTRRFCYVGGYWPYKGRIINKYLLPLRQELGCDVFGWGNWPGGSLGVPADEEVPRILAESLICPCISEQHTHQLGIDLPERVFKAALSGALVIHDAAFGVEQIIPAVVTAQTPEGFIDQCRQWVSDPVALGVRAEQQRAQVLAGHTYHHRMASLLRALGFRSEADSVLEKVASQGQ